MLAPHGADAFLIVVPYYNKPTQEGQYQYFKAVAESTDKPIVLYNVPGRTGVNMTAETTLKLAEIENVVAVKEASGNRDFALSAAKNLVTCLQDSPLYFFYFILCSMWLLHSVVL